MSKVAIFAHYDVNGIGDHYLEAVFGQLLTLMDKVIVVTTSGFDSFPLSTHPKIEVIHRDNVGYDFYSYKVGIDSLNSLDEIDQLILLNDSFYINNNFVLKSLLNKSKSCDIYGITANNQFAYHLQSYFLIFNRAALTSYWFYDFWKTVYTYKNKMKIVLDYEVNLTVSAKKSGLKVNSLLTFEGNKNPCHDHPLEILDKAGLLKVDVLRNNIVDINVEHYFSDYSLISEHVKRTKQAYQNRLLGCSQNSVKVGNNYFEYDNLKPNSDSAVILHLYYVDLAQEICSHLNRIPFNIDLFVTVSDEKHITHVINVFSGSVNRLCVAVSENRGRDVKPFIDVMKAYDFNSYDLVLKLHSKKSKYSQLGESWRDDLYRGLIPSSAAINALKNDFQEKNIGVAASFSSYLSNEEYWGSNKERFEHYCLQLGVEPSKRKLFFVGGTMFWFSPKALYPLVELISNDEFEEEENQQDGTLAHAFERLVCMSAFSNNMKCADILDIDFPLSYLSVIDNKVKVLNG